MSFRYSGNNVALLRGSALTTGWQIGAGIVLLFNIVPKLNSFTGYGVVDGYSGSHAPSWIEQRPQSAFP